MSAALSPDLVAACGRLCAHTDFTGLAMFEFRRDPATEATVLLEVNARPWGSMPLPVALGVDFPRPCTAFSSMVRGSGQRHYRQGSMVATSISTFPTLSNRRRRRPDGSVAPCFSLAGWLGSRSCYLGARNWIPWPATIRSGGCELRLLAARGCGRLARRLPGHSAVGPRLRPRSPEASPATGASPGKPAVVAFICYGNICRSAFAEQALTRPWRIAPSM